MIILEKTEDAATSDTLKFTENPSDPHGAKTHKRFHLGATFRVIGVLALGEFVRMEYYDGDEWRIMNVNGNAGVILDDETVVRTIHGSVEHCRIYKSATPGNPIGVEVR